MCREHFTERFESRVRETIDRHGLIRVGDRIAVAVSGGKDSLTVLTLLHRWYGQDARYGGVVAIAVDEGIPGYRDATLDDARRVCAERGIELRIVSFQEIAGSTLADILAQDPQHPCTVCGALRRHALLVGGKGFDVLATGHNADDESQAVLMNLIKGHVDVLARQGPASDGLGCARRIKPLYACTEREVAAYALLHGLLRGFHECPFAKASYRGLVRDELNTYASTHGDVKRRLLNRFLLVRDTLRENCSDAVGLVERNKQRACSRCNLPASGELCAACTIIVRIGSKQ
jgi:uncharacterized protein (TIGR00269 family)